MLTSELVRNSHTPSDATTIILSSSVIVCLMISGSAITPHSLPTVSPILLGTQQDCDEIRLPLTTYRPTDCLPGHSESWEVLVLLPDSVDACSVSILIKRLLHSASHRMYSGLFFGHFRLVILREFDLFPLVLPCKSCNHRSRVTGISAIYFRAILQYGYSCTATHLNIESSLQ